MSDAPQPRKEDELDTYQDIQAIYLEWHNGRRPLSGFVRAIEALCHKRELLARQNEHIQTSRLLNATMQDDAGYDKPITPEDIRNVIYDRYVTLTKEPE